MLEIKVDMKQLNKSNNERSKNLEVCLPIDFYKHLGI